MRFRVIEPAAEVAAGGYVLPAGAGRVGEMAGARPVAAPADADGRVAQAGMAASMVEQPAWGWGLAPVRLADGETPAGALTALPENPSFYTVRQQDAVRRDLSPQIGDYLGYAPEPFVTDH